MRVAASSLSGGISLFSREACRRRRARILTPLPILTVTPRSHPDSQSPCPWTKNARTCASTRGDLRDGASRRRRGLRVRRHGGRRLHLPGPTRPRTPPAPSAPSLANLLEPTPRAFHPSPDATPSAPRVLSLAIGACPTRRSPRMGLSRSRRRGCAPSGYTSNEISPSSSASSAARDS